MKSKKEEMQPVFSEHAFSSRRGKAKQKYYPQMELTVLTYVTLYLTVKPANGLF